LGRGPLHRHRIPRRLLLQLPPVPARLPAVGPRPLPAPMTLLICTALRLEARALRGARAGGAVRVVRVGAGPGRARAAARRLPEFDVLVVAGFGGGLV